MNKIIKLVSVNGVSDEVKKMISDMYKEAINVNQVMLDNIPDYQFSQGDILYFTDLRHTNPVIEELKVECNE